MRASRIVLAVAVVMIAVTAGVAVFLATRYPPAVATVVAALKSTADDPGGFEVVEYRTDTQPKRWSETANLRGTKVYLKWRERGLLGGLVVHERTFFVIHPDDIHHTVDVPQNFKALDRGILGSRERDEEWYHDLHFN